MSYSLGQRVDFSDKIKRISICGDINTDDVITVYKNETPYLEVTLPQNGWNPFNTAYIFKDYLCIGLNETVYFISIETGEMRTICVSMYFGYFYEYKNRLYVASGDWLYCFNCTCESVWISESVAVDGITVIGAADNSIVVSCEMDPPGGWINRVLSLRDGREVAFPLS